MSHIRMKQDTLYHNPIPFKTPTPTPQQSPTPSPQLSPSQSPDQSPTLSPQQSPTPSPVQSPTPSPVQTPSPSPVASPTPETTVTPLGVASATISPARVSKLDGMSLSSFAFGALFGAVLAIIAAVLIAKRIQKRVKARKRVTPPTGALPQGLEVGNAHNIGRRGNQEDAFGISDLFNQRLVSESGVFAVVADGMGGLNDGELVSAAAVGTMVREFPLISNDWMPQQKLLYLAQRANDAANEVTGGARNRGGSTLLATLIRDGKLWFVSVGDSRICLVRGDSLITLTRPHVYEIDLDSRAAAGELSFESALADGQRSALTSYIGMGELEALDYNPRGLQLLAGDWVLLMTDGVFNTLDDDEIASALHGNAQLAAERIESRVVARGLPQQDNLTVVALRIL